MKTLKYLSIVAIALGVLATPASAALTNQVIKVVEIQGSIEPLIVTEILNENKDLDLKSYAANQKIFDIRIYSNNQSAKTIQNVSVEVIPEIRITTLGTLSNSSNAAAGKISFSFTDTKGSRLVPSSALDGASYSGDKTTISGISEPVLVSPINLVYKLGDTNFLASNNGTSLNKDLYAGAPVYIQLLTPSTPLLPGTYTGAVTITEYINNTN